MRLKKKKNHNLIQSLLLPQPPKALIDDMEIDDDKESMSELPEEMKPPHVDHRHRPEALPLRASDGGRGHVLPAGSRSVHRCGQEEEGVPYRTQEAALDQD